MGCLPVHRVNWLKARAQRDRWQEDWTLVGYEMEWLISFFKAKANIWQCRSELGQLPDGTSGHRCYALRQKAMWEKCASHAHEAFEKVKLKATSEDQEAAGSNPNVP
jgi:hypothetical protein